MKPPDGLVKSHHRPVKPHDGSVMSHHRPVKPHDGSVMSHHRPVKPLDGSVMSHHRPVKPLDGSVMSHHRPVQALHQSVEGLELAVVALRPPVAALLQPAQPVPPGRGPLDLPLEAHEPSVLLADLELLVVDVEGQPLFEALVLERLVAHRHDDEELPLRRAVERHPRAEVAAILAATRLFLARVGELGVDVQRFGPDGRVEAASVASDLELQRPSLALHPHRHAVVPHRLLVEPPRRERVAPVLPLVRPRQGDRLDEPLDQRERRGPREPRLPAALPARPVRLEARLLVRREPWTRPSWLLGDRKWVGTSHRVG